VTTPPEQPDWQQQSIPAPPPLNESELRGPAPVGEAPKEVEISFWLWIATAALMLVGAVLTLAQRDTVLEAARSANTTGLTEEQLQSFATIAVTFYVIAGLVLAGLFVLFAMKARAGKNWARISLMILGGIVFLFQVLSLSILGILTALVVLGGLVMLNLKPSTQYFAANRKP
jgi:hypothetical protein